MDNGKYYVRCEVIPSCVQFKKILASVHAPKVLALNTEDVIGDLLKKDTPMFLPIRPELLKFYPVRDKKRQADAYKKRCHQFLDKLLENNFTEKDLRFISQSLSKMAFGMLSKTESVDIFIRTAQSHPDFVCLRKKNHWILSRNPQKSEDVGA